ncbi:leucyl aminopeptidase [Fomitopsis serialis]|uniref:leucyl aminopeptidase n=1 Tax=Fomitopsis serialis TaxID=139415 RepID=UPI00200833E2|nr:leucyl aminopeptidase [Neoantrodia serialis]KAH9921041.1 leucyl aminopeptidase [Neoantrodia serialis]
MSSSAEVDYRLPTNVKPTHCDVTVRTNLVDDKFDGIVTIDLDVKKDTTKIVFNTAGLRLSDVMLTTSGAKSLSLTPASIDFDETMERCTLEFPGLCRRGDLTDSLMGYYKSVGGEDEVYALTQFEPTAARRAFPCWDEPLLKATFSVTMISRADTVNLSNMPVESEDIFDPNAGKFDDTVTWLSDVLASLGLAQGESEKWKITRFAKSPPMSTYLVAFANGRFEYLEGSYTSPLSGKTRPLRAYATKDMVEKMQFALYVKERALPLYEQVFDIEYPLPKLDTLAAHDFDIGAMENWGLIAGGTSCFALDPDSEDVQTKKDIASTQCHEVAHMWFGNITTMEWWDNLYLNEGESIASQPWIFPEWRLHPAFITEHHKWALDADDNLSSHPVELECPDAEMVNQIFDDLSYSKAASVLRMLSSYVGEEKFLKGVSIYLKRHLFANSVTRDLWEGIQEASGIDVPQMMDNWVKKVGYPVLTVMENPNGIHVRQDRFLSTGPAQPKDNETIWTVPLSLLTVNDDDSVVINKNEVLDQREKSIALDASKPWKLNAGTVTLCRVLYSPERLVKIGREAAKASSPFSIEDRIGLVDDAFALSKAGYSDVSAALALTDVLRNEPEYLVWQNIQKNLLLLRSVWWEDAGITHSVEGFLAELFTPLVDTLGYEYSSQDSADTRELRTLAIEGAASGKSPRVVEELRGRFAHCMRTGDESKIPPELEEVAYIVAVREGGRQSGSRQADRAQAEEPHDRGRGAQRPGAHAGPGRRGGHLGLHAAEVRTPDRFRADYGALDKRFEGNYGFQEIVASFRNLSTDRDHEETAQFFEASLNKDTGKYKMRLDQTLEDIQVRSAWVKRSTADIQKWFASRKNAL